MKRFTYILGLILGIVAPLQAQLPTAVPPVISGVGVGTVASTSATIIWTTDIASSSQVFYGQLGATGSSSTLDPTLVLTHSVSLTGLTAGIQYNYYVQSVASNTNPNNGQVTTASARSAGTLSFLINAGTISADTGTNTVYVCNGTSCTAATGGGGSGPATQTNGTPNLNQTLLNLINSVTNSVGLSITATNTSGGIVKFEIAGSNYTGNAATATNATNATNATTATTATTSTNLGGGALGSAPYQSAAGTTTYIAGPTTSGHVFVYSWSPSGSIIAPVALDLATYLATPAAIGGTTPAAGSFSSLKDTALISSKFLGTNGSGTAVAAVASDLASFLAGLTGCGTAAQAYVPADGQCEAITGLPTLPTTPNGVPQILTSTPSGGVGQPAAWGLSGVPGRTVAGTTDTVVATDRGSSVLYNSASAVAVTLTTAATLGNNFSFKACNENTGLVTLTISAGAFLPGAGTTFTIGTNQCDVFSSADNVNWLPSGALFGQGTVTQTIASGSTAMGTGAITTGVCATVITVAATGVTTTDRIVITPNADPTAVTGYAVSATGSLYIQSYPTSGNVNFKVCNNTSGSLTPAALTINWGVTR